MTERPPPRRDDSVDDLMAGLREIQAYAAEIGETVAKARSAAPAQGSGHDESRMASAVIDRDGAPVSLTLERSWDSKLAPADLGPALLEAYQAAVHEHLAAWGDDLKRAQWHYDARELDERVARRVAEAPAAADPTDQLPESMMKSQADRDVPQLVEAVLGELDRAHQLATAPPPAAAPPAADTATVRVLLVAGQLQSVEVNAEWAERRSAGEINSALAQAVQTARLETPTPTTDTDPQQKMLDDLLGDVFAQLRQQREVR